MSFQENYVEAISASAYSEWNEISFWRQCRVSKC